MANHSEGTTAGWQMSRVLSKNIRGPIVDMAELGARGVGGQIQ